MSLNEGPQTIDRILVDPLTPGMYFNVYWSNEGEPANSEGEWDEKLWNRVPQVFQVKRKDTHALPDPIAARYIKIDFSHLQAKHFDPGQFQKPTTYKKHPKWVLDYYLTRTATNEISEDPFISDQVRVQFDFLDLAYNYYLDDLRQEPRQPIELDAANSDAAEFLRTRDDLSDRVDSRTLTLIRRALLPYMNHPALGSKLDYLLSTYTLSNTVGTTAGDIFFAAQPSVEALEKYSSNTDQVSTLDRERVVIEKNYPVMSFFVPCRHRYRLVTAKYTHNRAYFAGVKELALFRDQYSVAFDTPVYIESAGDLLNIERTDLVRSHDTWATYDDAA
jgi:hypothetical protein